MAYKFFFIISFFFILPQQLISHENGNVDNKIVCYYAYFEKNDEYKENLKFFLKHGLLDHVDYFFILNGKCSVSIPEQNNIVVQTRENRGFDFGAYAYVIKNFDVSKYSYHVFLNTSVRGPYLYSNMPEHDWTIPFLDLFNEDVKLVGTTINVLTGDYWIKGWKKVYPHRNRNCYPHVQSMMFMMDRECFDFLVENSFFDYERLCRSSFGDIVAYQEIDMSTLVLENGWNINCLLPKYKNLDFRIVEPNFNPRAWFGDPYYPGGYFGETIHPYDVIFFKTNRLPLPDDLIDLD